LGKNITLIITKDYEIFYEIMARKFDLTLIGKSH